MTDKAKSCMIESRIPPRCGREEKNMRVLFLDFDGVLNSDKYNSERDWRTQGNIDETRLPLLRRIIDETEAVIVLSTSWREHWDPDPARCAPGWLPTGELLARYGIKILDRTPKYGGGYDRDLEVRAWLTAHEDEVESFVILDDQRFGWGDLEERLVRTDMKIGRGLMDDHAERAIALLLTPLR